LFYLHTIFLAHPEAVAVLSALHSFQIFAATFSQTIFACILWQRQKNQATPAESQIRQ